MTGDWLRIKNMRFYGFHGLFPEEGRLGQRFEVDVEIASCFEGTGDLGAAPDVAQVDGIVDYPKVYALTEEIVTGERFGLVESLADRIASAILIQFSVEEVVVRVRKPDPPVQGQFDGVEVEVRRSGQAPS